MTNTIKLIISGLFTVFLLSCGQIESYSPEKVIMKALAAEAEDSLSFYGELKVEIEGIDDLDGSVMKEWQKNEKSRSEIEATGGLVVTVNDGSSISIYEEKENTALIMEDDNLADLQIDPKEEVEMILDAVKDTHDIETAGESTVADRPVFHLSATKKAGEKSLFGDQEFWIDKEHWIVLKMKATNGGIENEIQYTTIDFDAEIDDSIFQLELPDDVAIETMEDLESDFTGEEIQVADIPEKMNEDVLYLPDDNDHKLGAITYTEIDGQSSYTDITIDYKKDDGKPLMTLIIIEVENEEQGEDHIDEFEDVMEKVTIRQEEAIFIELHEFRTVNWQEDGLEYSIDLIDEQLTIEDVQKWTENMRVVK